MGAIDTAALTQELLRFNTINPPGMERACARHLGKLLEDAGFRCTYHEFEEARTTLVAEIGGRADGKAPICFTGHIDTVPLGAAPWTRDPFAGETDGDKMFGRGVSDMKSGIGAFVTAAIALAPHLRNSPGLVLVLTAGEEVGCEGAKYLADNKLLGRAGAVVVAEPTGNYPFIGHKGLCWVEVETRGKTAHGSMPEQGDNAILKMTRCIHDLEHFHFDVESHPIMGKPTMNIATLHAGLNTNSVPDSAKLTVDMRTVPGIDHVHLCQSLQTLLAKHDARVRKIVDTPVLYSEPHDEWIQSVYEVMSAYISERPEPHTIQFSTDGADLKRAFGGPPTVIVGPGEPVMAHQTDEWCSVHRMRQSVDAFTTIMKQWCGV